MKTTCLPGDHHNGFVATLALGHMIHIMNHTSCAQVHLLPQSHCDDNRKGTLFSSSFCETWALCVSWITYGHLYIY